MSIFVQALIVAGLCFILEWNAFRKASTGARIAISMSYLCSVAIWVYVFKSVQTVHPSEILQAALAALNPFRSGGL
ncbi:hypothetical protein ACFFK0_05830 [Paenibacillus chartarius]|uniref:Uncharacterized protein n=1 Tax=Paenibacillus chartarius TaxID=747481 RepID=A0ABV6DH52_9BACL